ncbi:MAG: methyltransferase domain-containing protein [Candidatus Pelagibacter sp.]|tara:strand:- start:218 stop:895 length:678 start_codon:yes stop_codon:yes gene_type:complete
MIKKIIGNPNQTNEELKKVISKIKVNYFYINNQKDFRSQILKEISEYDTVLDIGKAMRDKHSQIKAKKIDTLDVNDFGDYPDIICDICSDINGLQNTYDKIICIAILEHVYNPFKAIDNLKKMLKDNGTIYGYVPYLFYYHAPKDLKYQDYFRFSKDALAYLFKDFSKVELYPIRGRISTPLNIMFAGRWKKYIEKTNFNIFLDKFASDEKNLKQCSGFNFIVKN